MNPVVGGEKLRRADVDSNIRCAWSQESRCGFCCCSLSRAAPDRGMVIWRNFGPLYASQTLPRPKVRVGGCHITSPREGLVIHGAFGLIPCRVKNKRPALALTAPSPQCARRSASTHGTRKNHLATTGYDSGLRHRYTRSRTTA